MSCTPSDGSPLRPDAINSIGHLVVLLGPYRNLSTLTAAVCALHPQVQVMNHGAERLLTDPAVDFLSAPNPAAFDQFVKMALRSSTGGRRGDWGGSILFSHAFDSDLMRDLYRARFGDMLLKPDVRCLLWKDPARIQRRLMNGSGSLDAVMKGLPRVKFLLPIRHPVDCALSNVRTGHITHILGRRETNPVLAVDAVLEFLAWTLRQRDVWPDRIFAFHQGEVGSGLPARLSAFMDVDADPQWLQDARAAFVLRARRRHADALMEHFRRSAAKWLAPWPSLIEAFDV